MLADQITLNDLLEACKKRAAAQAQPSAAICHQLQVLETSQGFILLLIGAIILSYYTTTIQKKELKCALGCQLNCNCLPDTFVYSVISAIAVLIATGYFYILSEQQLCAPIKSCVQMRAAQNSRLSSLLVLLAAAIRLFNLFFVRLERP